MAQSRRPLEQIRIASPCGAAWDRMDGDERVRYCQECRKNVYNLSVMSRAEAEAIVFETEGRVCIRFYQRRDGTVLTENCPVGMRKARRWLALQLTAVSAAFAGLIALSPWANADRLRKTEWYQQIRHGHLADREPIRSLLDRIAPEPFNEMLGKVALPTTCPPAPPASPGS